MDTYFSLKDSTRDQRRSNSKQSLRNLGCYTDEKSMTRKLFLTLSIILPNFVSAAPLIIENGKPRAEIVLAEDAPRSTRFAARDLQVYLEKMSGAKLAVVPKPSGKGLVKLFVGESAGTRKLKLTAEELEYGLSLIHI